MNKPISIADALKTHWDSLKALGYSPQSITTYEYQLKAFESYLKAKQVEDLGQVTPAMLKAYKALVLAMPIALNHKCLKIRAMKGLFVSLERAMLIYADPSAGIKESKITRGLPLPGLTLDQAQRLIDQVNPNSAQGLRDRALLETLFATGARAREALALELEDLDLARGLATIKHGKGNKGRVVPLSEEATRWIKLYLEKGRPVFTKNIFGKPRPLTSSLWLSKDGKGISYSLLRVLLDQYGKAAGIEKRITCHDWRRLCLTECVRSGMALPIAAQMAGHATLDTLRLYCRVTGLDIKTLLKTHPREFDPLEPMPMGIQ
jgi:integrase/recombinase XerD